MLVRAVLILAALASLPVELVAQADAHAGHASHAAKPAREVDTTFATLQERGKVAMGVDQYTSTHRFDALADGGRIELQRDGEDSAGVAQIRGHMREIAAAFRRGDFTTPFAVHAQEVPGTRVMTERRRWIAYTTRDLPRGAEVRLTTRDPAALDAIREFMAFQRGDHHAAGAAP